MTAPALPAGERAADAQALAVWLDVPVGTLQRWAQIDGWPRRHTTTAHGRRTLYALSAARDSYTKRRPSVDSAASLK